MSRRTIWITLFLATTVAAVGEELLASFDRSPATVPWTELLTDLPWWVTMPAALLLSIWLPLHLASWYRRRRAAAPSPQLRQGGAMQPAPSTPATPTQVRHPWRATLRTLLAAGLALASLAPAIAATAHVQ